MYNISIKNLKHSEFASQETHCFDATVYVNGKRAFLVSNQGHGGGNDYRPLDSGLHYQPTRDFVNLINQELSKEILPEYDISNDLDIVIGDLVNDKLVEKDVKRMLKRVTFFDGTHVRQLATKYKPTPDVMERFKNSERWKSSYILLNELSLKDATKIYRTAV